MLHKAVVCVALQGGLRCADLAHLENDNIEIESTTGVWISYNVLQNSAKTQKTNRILIPKPPDKYVINYINNPNKN